MILSDVMSETCTFGLGSGNENASINARMRLETTSTRKKCSSHLNFFLLATFAPQNVVMHERKWNVLFCCCSVADHPTMKEAWLDMDTVDTDAINTNLRKQTYFKSSCRCYLQKSNKILPLNST